MAGERPVLPTIVTSESETQQIPPPSILFTPSPTTLSPASSVPPSPDQQNASTSNITTSGGNNRRYKHANKLSVDSAYEIIANSQRSPSVPSDTSSTRAETPVLDPDHNEKSPSKSENGSSPYPNVNRCSTDSDGTVPTKPSRFAIFCSHIPLIKKLVKVPSTSTKDDDKESVSATALISFPDPSPQEMGSFTLMPSQIDELFELRSLDALDKVGGMAGLAQSLHTNCESGLADTTDPGLSYEKRSSAYGANVLPQRKTKSLFYLMWLALHDKVLILLCIAAAVSLALGLYQDIGAPPRVVDCPNGVGVCHAPDVDWVEGVAILVAVIIVVTVGSLNDWRKERQFKKLNAQKEERYVRVVRNGEEHSISVFDILVGDILVVNPGDILPVDGVLVSGHQVVCDESSATGESDSIKKFPADISLQRHKDSPSSKRLDPFLISGAKVTEGTGRYIATNVGKRSFFGKVLLSLQEVSEDTPLQLKLNRLAELIAKLGGGAGLVLFVALMIRYFVSLGQNNHLSPNDKAQDFIQVLIIAVTVIVVAVPEGLPLAVTLALAFATRRMTKMNLLVRVLSSCEIMANATVICTDKTGTLTQNVMTVVAGSIGVRCKFAHQLATHSTRTNAEEENDVEATSSCAGGDEVRSTNGTITVRKDFAVDMNDINTVLNPKLSQLLNEAIALNSQVFEDTNEQGKLVFKGNATEAALLTFAKNQGWRDYREVRNSYEIIQSNPFNSTVKSSSVIIKLADGRYRLFIKGAAEILCRRSTKHVVVRKPGDTSSSSSGGEVECVPFDDETTGNIDRTIIFYADQSFRTIALCYRDFNTWPLPAHALEADGQVKYEELAKDLTLLTVTAIQDPLRDHVSESVQKCQGAGVAVKMVTGDNVLTAKAIAYQCGIYTAGGLIMDGPTFRKLSKKDLQEVAPRIQVLARSSPIDKKLLVETLKGMGEVVGVTGDGVNDAPALKTANVGFSMGVTGTEIAKEASDIILMDDNFASIVSAIMWGRCVNDSVRKFLQFQISVNITAVVVTFVTAVASPSEDSVLTAVQLLWVNLIMDTFAAVALATDPATPESLERKPDKKMAPLISIDMWKMILSQSIFQLIVTFVLHFGGHSILNAGPHPRDRSRISTLVFNTFVWCQIFNMLNARRLDRGMNIFSNWKNYQFWIIFVIMCGGQALIVNFFGASFSVTPISGAYWAVSIIIGLISLPLAVVVKLIPSAPFERWAIRFKLFPDPNVLPSIAPEIEEGQWNDGITKVIDNLSTFGKIKGGRMRSSSLVIRSRSSQLSKHDIHPTSLLAMVPSLVASSVGAGWRSNNEPNGSLSDPASFQPTKSTVALWTGQVEVHPDTSPDDDFVKRYHISVSSPSNRSRSPSAASLSSPSTRQPLTPEYGSHRRTHSTSSVKPPSSFEGPIKEENCEERHVETLEGGATDHESPYK